MNKKILVSSLVIGVVALAAIGGTIAYFSDKEVSTGNVMVAGTIDLKVDHKYQTYNGIDCKTCSLKLVSDTSNMVVAMNDTPVTAFAAQAVPTPYNSRWTAQNDASIVGTGATWIWATGTTTEADAHNNVTYTFEKHFTWDGPFTGATVTFAVGSDNNVEVLVNGHSVYTHTDPSAEGKYAYQKPVSVTIDASYINGGWVDNVLTFKVKNIAQEGSASGNPGGLLYAFKVNGNCDPSLTLGKNCTLFQEKNLTPDDKFWKFDDIKPGDWGTNLISLHPTTNDSKICSYIFNINKTTDTVANLANGINVFVWRDLNGNGKFDDGTSTMIYNGSASGLSGVNYNDTIAGNSTAYMGIAWCAGTPEGAAAVAADPYSKTACSPVSMGNEYQGAGFNADFGFYAVQARHNDGFTCPSVGEAFPK